MYLKDKEIEVIELLAKFKFLTSSQFVKLEVYKNRGDVTNFLKEIIKQKRPIVDKIVFSTDPQKGKLEYIYYLTKYGEKVLVEDLDYSIDMIKKIPKSKPISTKDYFHRKSTIDFYIYLSQWLNNVQGEILFLNYYFDKVGSTKGKENNYTQGLNRLFLDNGKSFIPDIITKFKVNNEEYLFLFEQHNGTDVKRLIVQLYIHRQAILERIASKKYDFNKSNRVVVICEFGKVKNNVIKKLQKIDDFKEFYNFFIFKTNEELKEDFFNNWMLINNQQVNFIQKMQ